MPADLLTCGVGFKMV